MTPAHRATAVTRCLHRARGALAAACLLLALAAQPAHAETRNITRENRTALNDIVMELRQTELMRISRGRVKSNPVIQPHFTIYQSVLQNRDLLLARQVRDYAAALGGLQRAEQDFAAFVATPLGTQASDLFMKKLIDTYHVADEFESGETLFDVWNILQDSGRRLQAMPVEYRLALNTGQWLQHHFRNAVPQDARDRFLALCAEQIAPTDIFDEQQQVDDLSARWAAFFSETTTGLAPDGDAADAEDDTPAEDTP